MSIFNFKKRNNNSGANSTTSSQKKAEVTLFNAEEALERHIVSLKKDKNIDLSSHRARVFVVLDASGSMDYLFSSGSVQETLTRILPLALKFDDNGELEVFRFSNNSKHLASMTLKNYEDYVTKEIIKKGYGPDGGTNYAPVLNDTISEYKGGSPYPAFGIFITDGDNWDYVETDSVVIKSSHYKIFYQFVGIGGSDFPYLEKLDNLEGRPVDNTAFIKVEDLAKLSDDELYAKLLEQYIPWLRAMNIN